MSQWSSTKFTSRQLLPSGHPFVNALNSTSRDTIHFSMPDNPNVTEVNVAYAEKATFIYSAEHALKHPSKTFTATVGAAFEKLGSQLGALSKPMPTDEDKRNALKASEFWAFEPPMVPILNVKQLLRLKGDNNALRQQCVAHNIDPMGNAGQKLNRLKLFANADEVKRQDAISEAMNSVVVDTDPSFQIQIQIYMAITADQRNATGGDRRTSAPAWDHTAKISKLVWYPGIEEPQASVDIAKQVALINACTDSSREQRRVFIMHWRKIYTTTR